jgi:hypothetical protein
MPFELDVEKPLQFAESVLCKYCAHYEYCCS